MITIYQAIFLGLFQGVSELFPISSLGHSVIIPPLLGWNINESDNFFLFFLVATHFATSLALLTFFYKDWVGIVKGFLVSCRLGGRSLKDFDNHTRSNIRLAWVIIAGTIPAGILGLLLQTKIQHLFASPRTAAIFLIVNGIMLWTIELKMRAHHIVTIASDKAPQEKALQEQTHSDERISRLTWGKAIRVGLAQAIALIPGFSRTGATIGGGFMVGLSREDAARFSFLLATPIIFAAAVLKLPQLFSYLHTGGSAVLEPLIVGFIASFIAAFFSVRFLVKYFKTETLMPFAVYCMIIGVVATILL